MGAVEPWSSLRVAAQKNRLIKILQTEPVFNLANGSLEFGKVEQTDLWSWGTSRFSKQKKKKQA
jgi:hypothetical protein